MKENFDKSVNLTLGFEGGFVDDPADKGGSTKYGISQASYPDVDIATLTIDDAKDIYKRDYWNKVKGDDLPSGVDFLVFDFAVNSGVHSAGVILQQALNRYNCGMKVDGIIGSVTVNIAEHFGVAIIPDLLNVRRMFYEKICVAHPDQEKFRKGWMNRVDKLAEDVKQFA